MIMPSIRSLELFDDSITPSMSIADSLGRFVQRC